MGPKIIIWQIKQIKVSKNYGPKFLIIWQYAPVEVLHLGHFSCGFLLSFFLAQEHFLYKLWYNFGMFRVCFFPTHYFYVLHLYTTATF